METERDKHYARWKKAVQRTMKWEVNDDEEEGKKKKILTHFCGGTIRGNLRGVPTFVTAHIFYASRDTQGFLWVVPTNTGIFYAV